MEEYSYVPVPCLCSATVLSYIEDNFTYEISVYSSPLDKFQGPVYAKQIYQSGQDGNLKQGDQVQVLMSFFYGGANSEYLDYNGGATNYIIGVFNERSVTGNLEVEGAHTGNGPDRIRFINRKNDAGLVLTDSGKATLASGSIYHLLNPYGFGINQNSIKTNAQNHIRVVSHNPPLYQSREHFGMFSGANESDRLNFTTPESFPILFRRFVTQTRSPNNWVSTCEGSYAPWVGANNDYSESVKKSKEVLLSKVINHGSKRATIEIGEPGESFINVRIDDVIVSEPRVDKRPGANTGVLGNRFKLTVSDDGAFDIRAGGQGLAPIPNVNKFHMSVDADGNMTIHSSGKIELSHGDKDADINSIVMDPNDGIDIVAKNGFRVNGKPLVNQSFLDWMVKYQTQLCQVTSIGGPAPINPVALPEFTSGNTLIDDAGGFTTKNSGAPATALINDDDDFDTV